MRKEVAGTIGGLVLIIGLLVLYRSVYAGGAGVRDVPASAVPSLRQCAGAADAMLAGHIYSEPDEFAITGDATRACRAAASVTVDTECETWATSRLAAAAAIRAAVDKQRLANVDRERAAVAAMRETQCLDIAE